MVLVDIVEGVPQGKALDMMETAPVEGYDVAHRSARTTTTAPRTPTSWSSPPGSPRKPGMSRDDLLKTNDEIVGDVTDEVVAALAERDPDRRLESARRDVPGRVQASPGFPQQRVLGMAGVLDSARMRAFIADGADVSVENIARLRPRRPRRHDGPAAALLDRGRHPDHRAAAEGAHRRDRQPHRATAARRSSTCSRPARPTTRRRRPPWRWSRRSSRTSTRSCPAPLPGGRVRHQRPLRRRAGASSAANGLEKIIEIKLTDDEHGRAAEVGGGGQGARRRPEALSLAPPHGSVSGRRRGPRGPASRPGPAGSRATRRSATGSPRGSPGSAALALHSRSAATRRVETSR